MHSRTPARPGLLRAAGALLAWVALAVAAPAAEDPCHVPDAPRVVAVGDVHGSYDNLVRVLRFTGITDARFYINDVQIPTIIMGPGSLTVAHTANEWVLVDDLVAAARIYARIFVGFLGARAR